MFEGVGTRPSGGDKQALLKTLVPPNHAPEVDRKVCETVRLGQVLVGYDIIHLRDGSHHLSGARKSELIPPQM